jgi:prenyltransferase beta subunit
LYVAGIIDPALVISDPALQSLSDKLLFGATGAAPTLTPFSPSGLAMIAARSAQNFQIEVLNLCRRRMLRGGKKSLASAPMSLRLEMLQVARLAPRITGEAAELIAQFVQSQYLGPEGFMDRNGKPDLYYTVFGRDCLAALQAPEPELSAIGRLPPAEYADLDMVHLCCFARLASALWKPGSCDYMDTGELVGVLLDRFRTSDGGFNPRQGAEFGTAYGAFLALGAFQDLGIQLPRPLELVRSLKFLETPDGGWANERAVPLGSTNATAAAVAVLRNLQMPINPQVGDFLLKMQSPEGGFKAAAQTPIPDLLSTATALHALAGLERDLDPIKEQTLDFIDTLWTNEGSFYGNWTEETLDCEYTFYALLALGHLSV